MAVAKLYPESRQGKRGTSSKNDEVNVASSYVREARTVLRWLPEIADLVMAGKMFASGYFRI